jgi:hypothetical protein
MKLVSANIGPFRSVNGEQTLRVEPNVTALVGMNESGKTVILRALEKSGDAARRASFNPIDDYPRKELTSYLTKHKTTAAVAVTLTYAMDDVDSQAINRMFGIPMIKDRPISISYKFDNSSTVALGFNASDHLSDYVKLSKLSALAREALANISKLEDAPAALAGVTLEAEDTAWLQTLNKDIGAVPENTKWDPFAYKVWLEINARTPKFLYFGDYDILPSKVNIADLVERMKAPDKLTPEYRGIIALLRMAEIAPGDFTNPSGYEELKAKLEAVSIRLIDQVMEFWKQNEDLDVEIDIKADTQDSPPFNNGANVYLRIKNRRHRGVSTPFQTRSRGFTWFFSFLVWFDDVRLQMEKDPGIKGPLILLLDEPGVSLHALAQRDFLAYIEDLGSRHQVIYTTHSPFMISNENLNRVRIVEDQKVAGTTVSDQLQNAKDARTTFPLQAALGWSLSQNLFIGERGLLVEGPSELVYMRSMSALLGDDGLSESIVITPCGGLDKIATFVALLGANDLRLVVFHDFNGKPDQRISELVREKIIAANLVVDPSMFRDPATAGKTTGTASDIEDLFDEDEYIDMFNKTFDNLPKQVAVADLIPGARIVARINEWLDRNSIKTRPSGGFNHYLVAQRFASTYSGSVRQASLQRFRDLFARVNTLLT